MFVWWVFGVVFLVGWLVGWFFCVASTHRMVEREKKEEAEYSNNVYSSYET